MKLAASVAGSIVALTALAAFEGDARACGGCFTPPENPTVVTDHRMILSVSKEQSTLYDQIRYQGDPSAFAWVLPVSGTVEVGLSADVVFEALNGMTQTQINAPPLNCPPRPNCDERSAGFAGSAAPEDASGGGVTVTKREVVGPYETVQLKATDPAALQNWLTTNNFNVPADVQPVVNQYVTEKFDFLALKLIPGKGVQDMRPVRVTTKGPAVVLPLRMVAAGTGPVVGIGLWVIGEGRYEPQNFPSFFIPTAEIAWDWTQGKSNYTELRAARATAGAGRAWELESSTLINRGTLENAVQYGYFGGGGAVPSDPEAQAQQAYLPVIDAQGVVVKTAQQVRSEDMSTLFSGIPTASVRATRLRADLAHAALDADLVMIASQDQAVVSNIRQLSKEIGEPLCPVWDGCNSIGQAPRSEAQARANGGSESFSCTTVKAKSQSPFWLGIGAGFLALALGHAVRRHRR
ncbi:MAG: DUF2330 domain-containing protein [Labilithrix sp.]|nr:DUF2330 domain-containing protein [Labilithrix sp.]